MSTMDQEELGELLSAYIDGELDAEETNRAQHLLRHDEGAQRLLDELRRTVSAVSALPRHRAPDSIAEDVELHVERSELLSGPEPPGSPSTGRRLVVPAVLSAAAVLGLAVGGMWIMMHEQPSPTKVREDVLALRPTDALKDAAGVAQEPEPIRSMRGRTRSKGTRTMGKTVSRGPAVAPKLAEERSSLARALSRAEAKEGDSLLTDASFNRKLRSGMGVASIRTHAFGNEAVRLQIPVRSEAQRDAVAAKLIACLAGHNATDLSQSTAATDGGNVAEGSFYYRGERGVNFKGTNGAQFLVRASRRDLTAIVGELANVGDAGSRMTLVVEPLLIRGVNRVRAGLHLLSESDVVTADSTARVPLAKPSSATDLQGPPKRETVARAGARADTRPDREPPSLVDRRVRELEKLRRARREADVVSVGPPVAEPAPGKAGKTGEHYVTLVVEIVVAGPPTETKPPVRPESRSRKERVDAPTTPADVE